MPDPIVEAFHAVYTALEDDAQIGTLAPGGVWTGNAPLSVTAYPYLALSVAVADDEHTLTRVYMHSMSLWLRAVDKGDDINAGVDALARAYALLNDQPLAVTGFTLERLRRLTRRHTTPSEKGVTYQNLIDEYAVELVPA